MRGSGRRIALAVGASLVLHGLGLALASLAPSRRPAPVSPIELDVVYGAPERGPAIEAETRPAPPEARPHGTRRERRADGAASRTGGRTPPPTAPPPVVPGPEVPRPLVLLPPGGTPSGDEGDGATLPAPPASPDEAARLTRRIEDMFGEAAGKRRAERPDAHWLDVKRALGREFHVSADLLEARPGGGAGGQVGDAVRGWLADAERYGKTGRPRDGEIIPPHQRAVRDVDGTVGNYHLRPDEKATSVDSFVTVVRIEQDATGAVVRAEVIEGSGLPAYDAIALGRASEAARAGPPPSGEERSDWAFETNLTVVPPLPIAGCSVYADFTPGECFYPTKRIVKSRVRLVAVRAR